MGNAQSGKTSISRRLVVIGVLVVTLIAVAAVVVMRQRAVSPEALTARATEQFNLGNYAAAIIDLKSVVSRDPSSKDARRMLGQAYLKSGNSAGALKELQKARELGDSSPNTNLDIVRAMILTGKFDTAATEIALHGQTDNAEWLVLRGMLDLAQQRLDDARTTFKGILQKTPENIEARRGLMQTELAADRPDLARAELDALLKSTTTDPALWIIRGELDLYEGNAEKAVDAFKQALTLAPLNPLANLGMARAQLALGHADEATKFVDALGADAQDDPRANFIRAQIADSKDDLHSALGYVREVLKTSPMHRESLILAAKLNFRLSEFTRAEDFIGRLLEIEPNNEGARRMLGAIHLASGRLDGVAQFEEGLSGAADGVQDPGMLALLGTAYLKHGKFSDGEKSLARAVELAPDSLPIRTQLAMSKLSGNKADEAIVELKSILAEDPNYVQAEIMLALAYLSAKQNDAAVAAASGLAERHPNDALAHNVFGYVLESTGDKAQAKTQYETALTKDDTFHPARVNLARLAIAGDDLAGGKAYFEAILKHEPFHAFALLGLAALAVQDAGLDEAERLWQLAREHNPEAVAPRILLAKHYRAKGNLVLAEAAIKEAYKLAPFAPQVQLEYASLMLDTGKFEEALKVANALVERLPDSVEGLDLLARVYNQLGDEAGLTRTLERVTKIAPKIVKAQVLLGRLALRRKDFKAVERIVETLKADKEAEALGFELAGELHEVRGQDDHALAAFVRAFELAPGTSTVLQLARVEQRMGIKTDRLADWLTKHPDDLQIRLVHASNLLGAGANSDAIAQYEQMLKEKGENALVLNNLAWLYFEGKDERAINLAERAFAAAPKVPEIVDTYGWILFTQGKREQGLEMLEKAAELAPDNADIAYHVASALNDSGQTERAKQILQKLLKAEQKTFTLRKDAEALLAKIGE
jgi:putative PEP-CTERM system TPR-repeat lipoprotein